MMAKDEVARMKGARLREKVGGVERGESTSRLSEWRVAGGAWRVASGGWRDEGRPLNAGIAFCPHGPHRDEQSAISSQRSAFTRLHGIAHQRVASGGTKADR